MLSSPFVPSLDAAVSEALLTFVVVVSLLFLIHLCPDSEMRFFQNTAKYSKAKTPLKKSTFDPKDLPDQGSVRRTYPWNTYEPDRFSEETLGLLNDE
jgi:hypothetical protein